MKKNEKQNVALSSVVASILLTLTKFFVGIVTGSIGILSEAAHSLLDFGAATLTYFAVRIGDRPADAKHQYGHQKVESVSALIETGLLFITSFWIIYEAVQRLIHKSNEVDIRWYSFAVIILSIIIDYSRSKALYKVAKKTSSQALEADALHFSSDILSSGVVLIGLVFIYFGIRIADPIAAIGVSLFVLHAGYVLGKRTIDVLVDTAPEGLTENITKIVKNVEGVLGIEKLRIRPVGGSSFIDMIINISRKLPLDKANEINQKIEKEIRKIIKESDITIHIKPLTVSTETIRERVQIIAANHNLSVHDIQVYLENNKRFLSYDLEVDEKLNLHKSHEIASHLEKALKQELGEDIIINTHIEPYELEIASTSQVLEKEQNKINKIINLIISKNKSIKDYHKVEIKKVNKKFFITLHCIFDKRLSLEEVHNTASKLEYQIRQKNSKIQQVVIHTEPESKRGDNK
jgi:cation diffusion facilitator family transporter